MNSRRVSKIFCWFGLFFSLLGVTNSCAMAETLTYRTTLQKAVENSFDIKIASLDIDISKAELKATRSDLFPLIYAQANTEYNNGLGNQSNINYVGNTVVSSYTQYRDLFSLGLQYNLFDFGATRKKVLIARKDVEQKKVMVDLQTKDLKLKILDLYTKILQYNDELKTKAEILKVYEEMFEAKERLFRSGINDKISVMDEAVKIARTQSDIEESKLELIKFLNDLSVYTLQKYKLENLEVLDFEELNIQNDIVPINAFQPLQAKVQEEENLNLTFNPQNSLEAKYYDFELEKKKAELEMYKKQRYPAFKFYTNYLFYGQDPDNYFSSYSNFKQTSLAFGISGSFALFDGFKNKANKEKAALEIKKIQLEKEKKLRELQTEYEKTYAAYQTYSKELIVKKELLNKIKEKLNDVDRMYKNGFIERNELLIAKADLLNQEFDLEKNIIDISSKIKEIEIMTGKDTITNYKNSDKGA